LNIGDPNMDTLLKWSRNFSGMESRHIFERNYDKLVEIVQAIEYCIGLEFDEDVKSFQLKNGRTPKPHEEPFIHAPFHSYDEEGKNKFIQCVKGKTQPLLDMYDDARVNFSFRLWSGCLTTSKEISAKTQTGPNGAESRTKRFEAIINPLSQADNVFELGQKVAPFFKRKVGQGEDVFFDGIPTGSAILEVRGEFENSRIRPDS
jgi:hypothetical protein